MAQDVHMATGERMSGVDRAWLLMDRPTNAMVILGLIVLAEPLSLNKLRELVAERFLRYPRFRCLPVGDAVGARWVESTQFELGDHLQSAALPAPAGKRELEALAGELASAPLSTARPLWTFHLVEDYQGGSALIIRLHHCYADGIALMQVLLSLADGEPGQQPPAASSAQPGLVSMFANLAGGLVPALLADALRSGGDLAEKGLQLALHPGQTGVAAQQALGLATELARLAMLPDDPPTQLKQPLCGVKHVAWCEPLALQEVRTIGRVLGCTVNDVLVSILAGALGRYLESHGDSIAGVTIRATVPANLRVGPGSAASLGNNFGLIFLELPIGVRHPLERLYAVHSLMSALKASPQAMVTFGLMSAIGNLPAAVEDPAITLFSAKASLVASNVPGPRQPLYVAGVPVSQLLFWVPQTGSIGVGVSMLTYCDQVQLGVIADRQLIAKPAELLHVMADEFERLVLLVLLGAAALGD
jgi:WS/DGAT/MGAT family acyltransferase